MLESRGFWVVSYLKGDASEGNAYTCTGWPLPRTKVEGDELVYPAFISLFGSVCPDPVNLIHSSISEPEAALSEVSRKVRWSVLKL